MPDFDPNAAAAPDSGIFGLRHTPHEAKVVLVPVPFEATTSYGGGTSNGPRAIFDASKQVDLFDLDTGRPYEAGIAMLEESEWVRSWNREAKALAAPLIAEGGAEKGALRVQPIDALCEKLNAYVVETTQQWLSRGKRVGIIGGDHATVYGGIWAHAEKYPGLGILHVDAHADLRDAYEGFTWSHASIMHNVMTRIPKVKKLVQVGIRDFGEAEYEMIRSSEGRINTFFDSQLARSAAQGMVWQEQVDRIVSQLPNQVYVSFDIDGLDPVLCPHTGTPVPGGLSFQQACALFEGVARAGKQIVGFDLNEVSPGPEGDEWDGNVGARLLYKLIGWMLLSSEDRR